MQGCRITCIYLEVLLERFCNFKGNFTHPDDELSLLAPKDMLELNHQGSVVMQLMEVYTDAKMRSLDNDTREVGIGVWRIYIDSVMFMQGRIMKENTTVRNLELILMTRVLSKIQNILDALQEEFVIDIFCGSKYPIDCITNWIYTWKKNADVDGVYYTSTKDIVSGQYYIDMSFDLLCSIRLNNTVNLYQMAVSIKRGDIIKAFNKFRKDNPIRKYMDIDNFDKIRKNFKELDSVITEAHSDVMHNNDI